MATMTQKKKLSKGTWALILVVIVAVIAVAVLAAVGYISLAFLANWLVSIGIFGSSSWINEVIVLIIPFVGGVLVCYVVYTYFIGQKVTLAQNTGTYQPQGQTMSQPAQAGKETVVS